MRYSFSCKCLSSIVYVSLSTEENIHWTKFYALYLYIFSRTEFQKYSKGIGSLVEKRRHVSVWNLVQLLHPTKF